MAKLTGKDLAFLIGGTAVAVARNWSLEDNSVNVESTAAGDDTVDRDHLRNDHTAEFDALLEIASPYVLTGQSVIGTKVAWVGKVVDSHTNGIVSSTSLMTRYRIEAAYDGMIQVSGTLQAAGVPLTWDTSPAT